MLLVTGGDHSTSAGSDGSPESPTRPAGRKLASPVVTTGDARGGGAAVRELKRMTSGKPLRTRAVQSHADGHVA
jgi:hypothetical protein